MSASAVPHLDIVRKVNEDKEKALESAIAGLYGGALDDFIRRRDALSKELRTAGEKDSAATVKSLRKPSRIAWALDVAALDKFGAIETVVAAVEATFQAHSTGGDVRAAIANMRAAVRDFAGKAAGAAAGAGQRLDPNDLSNALFAVIGKPESLQQLRRGHLADVPEGGGLDVLAALPSSLAPASAPVSAPPVQSPQVGDTAETTDNAELVSAAREAVRRAGADLADARQRSEATRQALGAAESKLELTELQLRRAEEEVRAARAARDRASQEANKAAARLQDGETALRAAEQALSHLTRSG